jgi:hypothetical protein
MRGDLCKTRRKGEEWRESPKQLATRSEKWKINNDKQEILTNKSQQKQ